MQKLPAVFGLVPQCEVNGSALVSAEPESEAAVLTGDTGPTGSEGFPCLSLLH